MEKNFRRLVMEQDKRARESFSDLEKNPIENWRVLHQRYGLVRRAILYLPGRIAEGIWRRDTRLYLAEFERQLERCSQADDKSGKTGSNQDGHCISCPFYQWLLDGRKRKEQEVYQICILAMLLFLFAILLLIELIAT